MASLNDVAKHAGVALNTARKVLRNDPRVRPYIRERVTQAIKELDYHPNLIARALRNSSLPIVPIKVIELHDRFFGELARDLCSELVKKAFEPALYLDTQHLINLRRRLLLCGAILTGGYDFASLQRLSLSMKIVTITRHPQDLPNVGHVHIDFAPAYHQTVHALVAEGRRHIAGCSAAYARALQCGWDLSGKFDVISTALRDLGLDLVTPASGPVFGSPQDVASFLDAHPGAIDAVICENDHEASFLFGELIARGRRVPQDVRIVGCDANHMLRGTWSIRVDTATLAGHAVDLLQELVGGASRVPTRRYVPRLVTSEGAAVLAAEGGAG